MAEFDRQISLIMVDVAMKAEDVRKETITRMCYESLTGLKAMPPHFTHAMLFIACEYLSDLHISEDTMLFLSKKAKELVSTHHHQHEFVKLQCLNLIMKCALHSDNSQDNFLTLVQDLRPTTFDNLELLETTHFFQRVFSHPDFKELIRDSMEEELL